MILVDTSVLIDALRARDPKLQRLFATLQVAICGVNLAEVLCGARDPGHYQNLLLALARFPQVPIPESTWQKLGHNLYQLRSSGVTVPFPDVVIATIAIDNDIELWTRDAQFKLIQNVLPTLKLFVEPP